MQPLVSIVVCTYNRRDDLLHCLDALVNQDYPKEHYEILVMDNNSTDGTASSVQDYARRHPEVRLKLFPVPTQGLSNARNRGIQVAEGDPILFIDDDALAERNWISTMVTALAMPAVSAVGGRVALEFLEPRPCWLTARFHCWLSEYGTSLNHPMDVTGSPWPVGCNMGFRAGCLADLGGFNPDLGRRGDVLFGGEETDLFKRIFAAGGKVVATPAAVVRHQIGPKRMRLDYFLDINLGLGEQRVLRLRPLSFGSKLYYLLKFTGESAGNFLLLVLTNIIMWSRERTCLAYLQWRRSLAKLLTLMRFLVRTI